MKNVILILLALIITASCSNEQGKKEAQKILIKQAILIENEQESIDQIYDKMETVKDSLSTEEIKLTAKIKQMAKEAHSLKDKKEAFKDEKTNELIKTLEKEKEALYKQFNKLKDSISAIENKMHSLKKEKDTLVVNEINLSDKKIKVKGQVITGIDKIDKRLLEFEKQSLIKQQELDLNKRKIALANDKIGLLQNEKLLYQRKKNDVLVKNSDNDKVEDYDFKIKEIQGQINNEQDKIKMTGNSIKYINSWMQDVLGMKAKLNNMIEKEYDKQTTLNQFIEDELAILNSENSRIDSESKNLIDEKQSLIAYKQQLEQKLATVSEEIELIKEPELAQILEEKSEIDQKEAMLFGDEAKLIKDNKDSSPSGIYGNDITLSPLDDLKNIINIKRTNIETLKEEIALEKQKLSEKKASIETKRAKNVGAVKNTITTILLFVVFVIIALFLVGRHSLKKKRA